MNTMLRITEEEFKKIYEQQSKTLRISRFMSYVTTLLIIVLFAITRFSNNNTLILIYSLIFLLITIGSSIFIRFAKKKYTTPTSTTKLVIEATTQLNRDLCSDGSISYLQNLLRQSKNEPEKIKLANLLVSVYSTRGQLNDAEALLRTIPRTCFPDHPDVAISFYADYMNIYNIVNDTASVEAIYKDLEPILKQYYNHNYIYCMGAVNALSLVHRARGEYQEALRYQLMQLNYFKQFNQSYSKHADSQLSIYSIGDMEYDLAQSYYDCGDYANAKKYITSCAPYLTMSDFLVKRVRDLQTKIDNHL